MSKSINAEPSSLHWEDFVLSMIFSPFLSRAPRPITYYATYYLLVPMSVGPSVCPSVRLSMTLPKSLLPLPNSLPLLLHCP